MVIISTIIRGTMVFTPAQLDHFFLNGPQMDLTPAIRARLAAEGLVTVDDFLDFKEAQLEQAIKNMRTSIPGIPAQVDPAGAIVIPAVPPIPPIIVPARSAHRLKIASIAFHYYRDTAREPTPPNMNYSTVLRGFYDEWEAIVTLGKQDKPSVPVLTKPMTPVKWTESMKDCLYRTFGVRKCPLSYVIRDSVAVAPEATVPLLPGFAYSEAAGSVLQEMIARLSHTDPLFKQDNAMVYSLLEEATRNTIYAPTIKPYARTKDGREAWIKIMSSHAGNDKWEQLQKEKLSFLMNTKWNGKVYSLEKFTGLHRSAYVTLEEAATYVNFQLPNERSRVGYLIDNIQSSDADLKARIATIEANINMMRDNFEAAVTYLLPADPYAKSRIGKTSNQRAEISDVTLKGKRHSTTGVDFRWYTPNEYKKLTPEQKQELYQWQKTKDGQATIQKSKEQKDKSSGGKGQSVKQLKAKVAALEKEVKDADATTLEKIKAVISDVTADQKADSSDSKKRVTLDEDKAYDVAAVALQQIIKRNKK